MKQSKSAILKVLVGVCIVVLFSVNAFARLVANGSPKGFVEPERPAIEGLVIEGAGYFLKSHSDTLLFLNKVELSDIQGADFTELQLLIDNAIADMQNAKTKYISLTEIADTAPYDQAFITALLNLDYASFQQNNGLNGVIFSETQTYLSSGDIRGVYHQLLSDTQDILDKLALVKTAVDAETIPEMSYIWRLNQAYSDTLFFGQYAAEVFYEVAL
ncbi:MAG: hypothetical protein GY950_28140 [bacterium]|nr:hypothetical protein [bacterium]